MNVLALSGSLRAASINSALLRAAQALAPRPMHIRLYDGMAALPLYNFEREARLPPAVQHLRDAVLQADALLIASPEYAHGVSSVMKTALDWLVSLEGFVGKPVALLNAQPRSQWSDTGLREILTTMSATLVEPASLAITLNAGSLGTEGMLASATVRAQIGSALEALRDALQSANHSAQ